MERPDPPYLLTEEASRSLALAEEEAELLGHLHLGTEHLLLGLLKEGDGLAAHVLKISGASLAAARAEVQRIVAGPRPSTPGSLHTPTSHLVNAVDLAKRESVEAGTLVVDDRQLLIGVLRERQGNAVKVLMALGVDLNRLRTRAKAIVSKEIPEILREPPESPAPAPTGHVFISYRRQDTSGYAGWLHERLAKQFGKAHVFRDVTSIESGLDFVRVIEQAVGTCEVLLALIGSGWLGAADSQGRRLDDPVDLVRLEIRAALERDIRTIPVLVEGASMPRAEDLPEPLVGLSRRNALRLSHESFDDDVRRLIEVLEGALRPR
jgi:hypothetical protein